MRKLTYWICHCLDDSPAFSIRARTRGEAEAERKRKQWGLRPQYSCPMKVTVEYENPLHLLQMALGEGGIDEGLYQEDLPIPKEME